MSRGVGALAVLLKHLENVEDAKGSKGSQGSKPSQQSGNSKGEKVALDDNACGLRSKTYGHDAFSIWTSWLEDTQESVGLAPHHHITTSDLRLLASSLQF